MNIVRGSRNMLNIFKINSSKKAHTKGQAALEYMITYGWAFVVIIAAVSVLGYFGFLNPNKYIPESCEFGEQLKCVDYSLHDDGIVDFRFRNNFETDIELVDVYADGDSMSSTVIDDGEIKKVTVNLVNSVGDNLFAGTKERINLVFEFKRNASGAPLHNVSGSLFAEVIDSNLI